MEKESTTDVRADENPIWGFSISQISVKCCLMQPFAPPNNREKMKSKKKIRFPKRELNSWLRSHHSWGESEWQELLQELNQTGFGEWVGNPEGRDQVGLYLETHRR